MTPTPKLRFVERQHGYKSIYGKDITPNMVRILQQWYESEDSGVWLNEQDFVPDGEWRDVPLEKEYD